MLIIVAATLLVWPFGEYAIDDDWGYVRSLQLLHRDGVLKILDLYQVSLVAHLFWGLLFTKLFGFSFTVTKLAVVALYCLECVAVIALLRRLRVSRRLIWFAALTLVFNPLHFYHAFLFNTDVPAIAWEILALLFYVTALDEDDGGHRQAIALALGSIFGALSFLVRQPGVLVHVALFAFVMLYDRRRLRSPWFMGYAFGPAVLIAAAFTYWYRYVHGPTSVFNYSQGEVLQFFLHPSPSAVLYAIFALAMYLGFFLFPLSLVTVAASITANARTRDRAPEPIREERPDRASPRRRGRAERRIAASSAASAPRQTPPVWRGSASLLIVAAVAAALAAMLTYVALHDGQTFPYLRNKITQFGYLRPNEVVLGERDVLWGAPVSWVVTIAAALSFIAFVHQLVTARVSASQGARRAADPVTLVVVFFALQLAYLLATSRILFDRHLLIVFPTAVVLLCVAAERTGHSKTVGARSVGATSPRLGTLAFALLLLPFVFYSIAGTHDVHAFSRAAFRAGNELLVAGIAPQRIDAGYAFDGWYVYKDGGGGPSGRPPTSHDAWWVWNQFPTIRTDYVVSLSSTLDRARLAREITQPDRAVFLTPDLTGYEVVKTYPYRTFWPFAEKTLYVLRDVGRR